MLQLLAKTRRWLTGTALILAILLGGAPQLRAWGGLGHRLVARLAETRLTPEGHAWVAKLLEGRTMADVANWADAIKPDRPETAPFHYVGFPRIADWDDLPGEASGSANLVEAIQEFQQVLAESRGNQTERREALQFLIHLVGDLHQPLHCAPEGDHGGNDVQVLFLGKETNLHKIWDSGLIYHAGLDEETYLAALLRERPLAAADSWETGNIAAWAAETNREAVWHAYHLPTDLVLGERYYEDNIRVVNRQLLKAGFRLASVINALARQSPPDVVQVIPYPRFSLPEPILGL